MLGPVQCMFVPCWFKYYMLVKSTHCLLSFCSNALIVEHLKSALKSDQDVEGLGSMFSVQLKGDEMSNLKSLGKTVLRSSDTKVFEDHPRWRHIR